MASSVTKEVERSFPCRNIHFKKKKKQTKKKLEPQKKQEAVTLSTRGRFQTSMKTHRP